MQADKAAATVQWVKVDQAAILLQAEHPLQEVEGCRLVVLLLQAEVEAWADSATLWEQLLVSLLLLRLEQPNLLIPAFARHKQKGKPSAI